MENKIILIGGRLSDSLKEEFSEVFDEIIVHESTEWIKKTLLKYGGNPLKTLRSIIVFDLGFDSLTDWTWLNMLTDSSNIEVVLVTRFTHMIPIKYRNLEKVTIWGYNEEIDLNDVYVKLERLSGKEKTSDVYELFG